jgi:hypothetical protein
VYARFRSVLFPAIFGQIVLGLDRTSLNRAVPPMGRDGWLTISIRPRSPGTVRVRRPGIALCFGHDHKQKVVSTERNG